MKKTLIITGLLVLVAGSSIGYVSLVSAQDNGEKSDGSSVATVAQNLKMTVSVNQNGAVKLQGKVVSSPNMSPSANQISVQSWFGTFTVNMVNAKILHRFGGQGTVSDIQVGDIVVVDGTANQTDTTIIAKTVRDMSVVTKSTDRTGVISNSDATSRTFTLTVGGSSKEDRKPIVIKVTANADAKIRIGNSEVPFTSLVNGMRARVWGLYNINMQTIAATRIDARSMVKPLPIVHTTSSATSTAQ